MISSTEVKSARHRLDGVLQSLISRRRGSSPRGSESDDDGVGGGASASGASAGHHHNHYDDAAKDRKPPRKKRRKDDYDDGGSYHHTYVMKLFDRSVDLAQFQESTPLYPIARAWIHNQPHAKSVASGALDVDAGRAGRCATEETGGDDRMDITRLPPPNPNSGESCRVPEVLSWPTEEFFVHSGTTHDDSELENDEIPPSQDVLLMNHLTRWRTIRRQWKRQCTLNEARYGGSMTIIQKMFEDSQANIS